MTERKPPGTSFTSWIDQQISEAAERGAFDNLPGAGKPLPKWAEAEAGQAWLRDYLRREGVSAEELLPTPLRLRKEVERLQATVHELRSEQEVRDIVVGLNRAIMQCRAIPVGPPVLLPLVDSEAMVGRWRDGQSAVPMSSPAPADHQMTDRDSRRPRWWRRLRRGRRALLRPAGPAVGPVLVDLTRMVRRPFESLIPLYRRGSSQMPVLAVMVRIVRHVVKPGDKYGRLTVIREVQKTAADGRRYRAALCRCDCGNEATPRISSLKSGDARSCGCSRGQPRRQPKHCPVCGTLAMIRRHHRSCSRACGYELARAARQAANPSYDVWHHRVSKARGPASGYACVDCGQRAQDWTTVNPASDDVMVRFQPRCRKCHRRYDGAVGEGNPRAKLTRGQVRKLRARRGDGLTYRQLAAEFGISDVSAHAAVNRRTWAHVS